MVSPALPSASVSAATAGRWSRIAAIFRQPWTLRNPIRLLHHAAGRGADPRRWRRHACSASSVEPRATPPRIRTIAITSDSVTASPSQKVAMTVTPDAAEPPAPGARTAREAGRPSVTPRCRFYLGMMPPIVSCEPRALCPSRRRGGPRAMRSTLPTILLVPALVLLLGACSAMQNTLAQDLGALETVRQHSRRHAEGDQDRRSDLGSLHRQPQPVAGM